MPQSDLPLYPKLSSIYNKIMQLAIAIFFIIILMNLSLFSEAQNKQQIRQNVDYVGKQLLAEAVVGIEIFLAKNDLDGLQKYLDGLSESTLIKEVVTYDPTGQQMVGSKISGSINDLYGVSLNKMNRSEELFSYVQELRSSQLDGYARLTLAQAHLSKDLQKNNDQQSTLSRLMLLIAGVVGFLLTRGFSRFSRQGFRLAKPE